MNGIRWLLERMQEWGDRLAVIDDSPLTYAALLERVREYERQIAGLQLPPGSRLVLHGDFSGSTIAFLLALLSRRMIVVPRRLGGVTTTDIFRIASVRGELRVEADGTVACRRNENVVHSHPLLERLETAGEGGFIFFTSGTTGEPRASLHDTTTYLKKFHRQRPAFRTINFLAFDHAGGINTLFSILSSGGTLVALDGRSPENVCALIESERIELLPVTPTFLKMILISGLHGRYDLRSLKLITYGTEPMPESVLLEMQSVFPNVRLKQTYGLTELGAFPTRSPEGDPRWLRIVGDEFETRIVDGVLWVRTRVPMQGYLNAPDPFTADGWYNTGDLVEERDGYFRILGRESDLINVGGEKVYPTVVESCLLKISNVREAAVTGRPSALMGHVVEARVQLLEPEDPASAERRIRAACARVLEPFMVPVVIHITEQRLYNDRFKKVRERVSL